VIDRIESRGAQYSAPKNGGADAEHQVYFATNRLAQGAITDWRSYGAEIVAPTDASLIIYASAFVEGIDLGAEGSGVITAIPHAQPGTIRTCSAVL
jgi:hypothetical protein